MLAVSTGIAVCRAYASRGVVDGYGLLLELLADVTEDLVDQVAKHNQHDSLGSPVNGPRADSWTMVSSAASDTCRENSRGELRGFCYKRTADSHARPPVNMLCINV